MSAPTIQQQTSTTGNTITTLSLPSGVQAGDLIVIAMVLAQDAAVGTPTVTDDLTASYGTVTLDGTSLANTDDRVTIWSVVCGITPHNGTCTVNMTGTWPSSGNRRFGFTVIRPGAGDRWSSARVARTGAGNASSTGLPWYVAMSGSNSGAGNYAIVSLITTAAPGSAMGADWNGDNTYDTVAPEGVIWQNQAALVIESYHQVSAGGTFAPASSSGLANNALAFSIGRAGVTAVVGIIYEVAPPWTSNASGRTAGKSFGGGRVIRPRSGRSNAAAKSGGRGIVYTGVWPSPGRSNAASKSSAGYKVIRAHESRARAASSSRAGYTKVRFGGGRSATVGDSWTFQWNVVHSNRGVSPSAAKSSGAAKPMVHPRSARGAAASKSFGGFLKPRRSPARSRAASSSGASPHVVFALLGTAHGSTASKSGGGGHVSIHARGGNSRAASRSSGVALGQKLVSARARTASRSSGAGVVVVGPRPAVATFTPALVEADFATAVTGLAFVPATTDAAFDPVELLL